MDEITIEELSKVFKEYNITEFKEYFKRKNIKKLNALNGVIQDVLIFAIYCGASIDVLKFILHHCQYEELNYEIYRFFKDGQSYSPLSMALKQFNKKIVDFLIKNNASTYVYYYIADSKPKIQYIIKSDLHLNFKSRMNLVWNLIRANHNDLLNLFFKIHLFDNEFILNCLNHYKKRLPWSREQFQKFIKNEKNKIDIGMSMYKFLMGNKNYDGLTILLKNDTREKSTIQKELFQLCMEGIPKKEDKLNFIQTLRKELVDSPLLDEPFYDNILCLEDRIEEMVEFFKENNISGLENYIQEHQFPLSYLNGQDHDLLILSIKYSTSVRLIQYIISKCHYESVNYSLRNEEGDSPLLLAISKNKFNIADLLIRNYQADINYKINRESILYYLLKNNSLNKKNFRYIINYDMDLSVHLINKFLETNRNDLLELMLKYYRYNHQFILNFLHIYKSGTGMSNNQIKTIMLNEENKIPIEDTFYGYVIMKENYKGIKMLYDYSNISKDSKKEKMTILKNALNEFYVNEGRSLIEFSNLIRNHQLDIEVEDDFLNSLVGIKEHGRNIMEILNKNDFQSIGELKLYISRYIHSFPLDFFNLIKLDLLIYAIEHDCTLEMLTYIIQLYPTLNYTFINERYRRKSPLLSALSKNNFKVADLLIENGADIHYVISTYKSYSCIDDYKIYDVKDAFYYLYHDHYLNNQNLKYMLDHIHYINPDLLNEFIDSNKNDLMKTIFHYYIYSPDYIIKLLSLYKNHIPISNEKLKKLMEEEKKSKFVIPLYFYKTIAYGIRSNQFMYNYELFNLLLDYDTYDQEEWMEKVEKSQVLWNAVKDNHHEVIEKILNHPNFNIKKCDLNFVISEVFNSNNKINLLFLFLEKIFSKNNPASFIPSSPSSPSSSFTPSTITAPSPTSLSPSLSSSPSTSSLTSQAFKEFNSTFHCIKEIILQIIDYGRECTNETEQCIFFIIDKLLLNYKSFILENTQYFMECLYLLTKTNHLEIIKFFIEKCSADEDKLFNYSKINIRKTLLLINSVYDTSKDAVTNNEITMNILGLFIEKILLSDSSIPILKKIVTDMLFSAIYINNEDYTEYLLKTLLSKVPLDKLFSDRDQKPDNAKKNNRNNRSDFKTIILMLDELNISNHESNNSNSDNNDGKSSCIEMIDQIIKSLLKSRLQNLENNSNPKDLKDIINIGKKLKNINIIPYLPNEIISNF